MIETDRLVLRAPTDADRPAIAAINGDPEVGAWLARTLTREESDALVDRILDDIARHGFGFWAVERKADGAVIGLAGLMVMADDLPRPGAIELGWRLSPAAQGQGYATEAAAAARDWALANRPGRDVVAITAESNVRSQAVMRRIGLRYVEGADFDHPRLADGHPLRRHVLWVQP